MILMSQLESLPLIWFFTVGLLLVTFLYNRFTNQPTSFPRTLLQFKRAPTRIFKAIRKLNLLCQLCARANPRYSAMLWQSGAINVGRHQLSARFLSMTIGLLMLFLIPLYTNSLSVTFARGNVELPITSYEEVHDMLADSFAFFCLVVHMEKLYQGLFRRSKHCASTSTASCLMSRAPTTSFTSTTTPARPRAA